MPKPVIASTTKSASVFLIAVGHALDVVRGAGGGLRSLHENTLVAAVLLERCPPLLGADDIAVFGAQDSRVQGRRPSRSPPNARRTYRPSKR